MNPIFFKFMYWILIVSLINLLISFFEVFFMHQENDFFKNFYLYFNAFKGNINFVSLICLLFSIRWLNKLAILQIKYFLTLKSSVQLAKLRKWGFSNYIILMFNLILFSLCPPMIVFDFKNFEYTVGGYVIAIISYFIILSTRLVIIVSLISSRVFINNFQK